MVERDQRQRDQLGGDFTGQGGSDEDRTWKVKGTEGRHISGIYY